MKQNSRVGRRLFGALMALAVFVTPASAQKGEVHEVENMHVTIPATSYNNSRFIEQGNSGGKTYITGKASSYKRNGEANAGAMLQPCAEYVISNKMLGGSYNVLVYYSVDSDKVPASPRIAVGMNTQEAQQLEVKTNKLPNKYVKANFKVKLLKGKKHTVKVWLPSEGVRIHEIKVLRALFNSKSKTDGE